MADRRSLGIIGYILGAVTAAVMLIGLVVINIELSNAAPAADAAYSTALPTTR